jgi:glycosyltransferase involved in cell wall biosynthesis
MTASEVTVAMSVYNGGRELRLAVQSILDQTFDNWEMVIVDDGSTDGAVAALVELDDPRIRVLADGRNLGLAARLNQIIGLAQTPYIARMDQDDIAHPERLARQLEFLSTHADLDLLGTRCLSMSEDQRIVGQLPFAETHDEICCHPWLGFHLAHPSWMGRTVWFRSHLYADPAPYCCEDQELLLRASATSRFHALREPLLAYRVRTKVPFSKLFRTRAALVTAQLGHFATLRHFGDAGLASLTFLVRVVADVARELLTGLRSDMRPVLSVDVADWQSIIVSAERRATEPH